MNRFTSKLTTLLCGVLAFSFLNACAIIRPGEVGVKQFLGKLDDTVHESGAVFLNPLTTHVVRVPIQTRNIEVNLSLPSKEGLNVNSVISILYRIEQDKARSLIENVGLNYENVLILSVFRSAAADVCAQFFAKDMHSGNRAAIEQKIKNSMDKVLKVHGFNIEAVLMKSIKLPPGLYRAIEDKLKAEQEAQRMQFVLQKERQEAERKKVEAAGIRDAHLILAEGMNANVIKWRSLEVFKNLANSPNSKLIITDGKAPLLINPDKEE